MPLFDRIAFHGGSTNWVGAPGSDGTERFAHHPLPGVELEHQFDRLVARVDKAAAPAPADGVHRQKRRSRVRPAARSPPDTRSVPRSSGTVGHAGEMQTSAPLARSRLPALDQALVQRIVLVGVLRDDAACHRILQPLPLEHRGLEHRGRRVGVVFQEFRRSLAVVAQIEASVEARVAALEARCDPIPVRHRNVQDFHHALVGERARRPARGTWPRARRSGLRDRARSASSVKA